MTVWCRGEDVAVVDSGDRVVVLSLNGAGSNLPRALEGSGSQIWRCIDGVRSEREIVDELAVSFGVTPEMISTDVHAFLAQLRDEGLISASASASGDAQ